MYNCFFNADSFIVFSTQRRGGAETQHLLEKTETLQLTAHVLSADCYNKVNLSCTRRALGSHL